MEHDRKFSKNFPSNYTQNRIKSGYVIENKLKLLVLEQRTFEEHK